MSSLNRARAKPFSSWSRSAGEGIMLPEVRRSHARLDRLFDRAAAFGPVLEGTGVVDLAVAHVLEQLGGQRGAAAGRAIENEGLVPGKILVVIGRFRVGAEFQHAARDMHGADDLAALLDFRRVAYVDHQ